jgi:hypothetical protein
MRSPTDTLTAAFCARTLSKPEWTHYAHLRVGLWHLLHHPPDEALELLRSRIRALNECHGVANSDSSGYHETITRFYVWRIRAFLDAAGPGHSVDELAESLILRYGAKDLPLRYWSREKLFSVAARKGWVEPDLAPLDASGEVAWVAPAAARARCRAATGTDG